VERHAKRLLRLNEARHIDQVRFEMQPGGLLKKLKDRTRSVPYDTSA
jgi:hypothetical protein